MRTPFAPKSQVLVLVVMLIAFAAGWLCGGEVTDAFPPAHPDALWRAHGLAELTTDDGSPGAGAAP